MKERAWIIIVCLLVFAGCKRAEQPSGSKQTKWKTVEVKRADTEVEQLYPATIEGRQDIEIRPQVQGKIVELRVREGQRVRRGQTLFVIDPVPYRAALAEAVAQVNAARARLPPHG